MRAYLPMILCGCLSCAATAADRPQVRGLPGKHAGVGTISLAADVSCSPAQSYAMWVNKSEIERFFAPGANVGSKAGDPYTIVFFPADDPLGLRHGTKGAHILAAQPNRFLAFEWVVFAGDKTKGTHAPPFAPPAMRLPRHLPTWVELSFAPAARGTHVEFHHYGFGRGPLWDQSRGWFTKAWDGVLERMTAVCSAKGRS